MATKPKGAPKRGPGRPQRADGLAADSEEARATRGIGALKVRIPKTTLALLDELAKAMGMSRGAAIVSLVGATEVEASAKRGRPRQEIDAEWIASRTTEVSLHEGTIALIDRCAAAWQCSRPAVIMRALSVCLAADGGIVARDLRKNKR